MLNYCLIIGQRSNLDWFFTCPLKVSKFQNEFMKSSFLTKYERKIVRISALFSEAWISRALNIHEWGKKSTSEGRNPVRTYFGRNDDFINSFSNQLTFILGLKARGQAKYGSGRASSCQKQWRITSIILQGYQFWCIMIHEHVFIVSA